VLRSNDQPGLEQELWGLLATYQVLRMAMADAARAGGLDRASFTIALEAARDTLTTATGILPAGDGGRIDLTGMIGRAVLAHPLPARRARYSARKVKSPISRYHARPADDDRPLATTSIDTVTTQIHEPVAGQQIPDQPDAAPPVTATPCALTSPPAEHPRRPPPQRVPPPPAPSPAGMAASSPAITTAHDPSHRPPPTQTEVLDLLRSDPYRPWRGRDVAQILNVTNINSLCTRMSQWAGKGLLHKIGRATFTLAPTP
jgi:hypothetical protein